jgi:hypothetical protein
MALWWYDGFDRYTTKELKESMAIKYDDIMKAAVEKFKKFGGGEKLKPTQKQENYYTSLPHSLEIDTADHEPETTSQDIPSIGFKSVSYKGQDWVWKDFDSPYLTVSPYVKEPYEKLLEESNKGPFYYLKQPDKTTSWDIETDGHITTIEPPQESVLSVDQETLKTIGSCLGKVIEKVMLAYDHESRESIIIIFTDGTALNLFDDGQQCCEKRWLASDDKSEDVAGGVLMDVQMEEGVDDEGSEDILQSQFIRIITDKAPYVVTAYNKHNGSYDGITVKAEIGTVTKS